MILDISAQEFRRVFDDERLFLPISWDGNDFSCELKKLYRLYIDSLKDIVSNETVKEVRRVTRLLEKTIDHYYNGFPHKAFLSFKRVMRILNKQPLKVYEKSFKEDLESDEWEEDKDPLRLFRVRKEKQDEIYLRKDLFHVPYNKRFNISTNRYSIAGYPSLYLGTSLDLCQKELKINLDGVGIWTSAYKLDRYLWENNIEIKVIELGIKPQDYLNQNNNQEDTADHNRISKRRVNIREIRREAYLLWYPLIAACSYIKAETSKSFAPEYIIPQIFLQWVRCEMEQKKELVGIRYFSCESTETSDLGYDYVFPTSGEQVTDDFPYCAKLSKAFLMTEPVCIQNYTSVEACEEELRNLNVDIFYKKPTATN